VLVTFDSCNILLVCRVYHTRILCLLLADSQHVVKYVVEFLAGGSDDMMVRLWRSGYINLMLMWLQFFLLAQ